MHFNELIPIDKASSTPLYRQVADRLTEAIEKGFLPRGFKLPGARKLALQLGLYLRTVEKAYEDLMLQGWVVVKPYSGTYVSENIPKASSSPTAKEGPGIQMGKAGFNFRHSVLQLEPATQKDLPIPLEVMLNDGHPNIQFMPAVELEVNYRKLLDKKQPGKVLYKENPWGSRALRQVLGKFLNESRGLNAGLENMLISKGNQYSIFMILSLTMSEGDTIVLAESGYAGVYHICLYLGLDIEFIATDSQGINVDQLEDLCRRKTVKALYLTPHFHYPTGEVLSANRRKKIGKLSLAYGFLIVEDDYDFDFHFLNQPLLPVAASEARSQVVYVGGLNRLISASLRVSYIIGPEDFLKELARMKIAIDKFSDTILEEALAITLQDKAVMRYRNKAVKAYSQSMEVLCRLVDKQLGKWCRYDKPKGGMGLWLEFDPVIDVDEVIRMAREYGVGFPDRRSLYTISPGRNGMRIGFASSTEAELTAGVETLNTIIRSMVR